MSDKVYVPDDIPSDFVYGTYGNDYITLYNKPSANNETLTYYRIYYKYSSGLVTSGQQTFGGYNTTYFDYLPISHDVFDRPDFVNILTITLLLTFCGVWLLNLVTSFIRKGGVLSGLI